MTNVHTSTVADVALIPLTSMPSQDSFLAIAEGGTHLPFPVKRAFMIRADQDAVHRGQHAHRLLNQIFICVAGAVDVVVDDGLAKQQFTLDSIAVVLSVPAG